MIRRLTFASLALVLVISGCGDDDDAETADATAADTTDGTDTTAGPAATAGDGTTPEATGGTTEVTEPAAESCTTDVSIVNAEAAELVDLVDGPADVAMVLADKGPHPANTVDYDNALDLAISGFEIEEDPQFGLSIPVGTPEVPEATLYASISLFHPEGAIEAGQTFIDQIAFDADPSAADGKINFTGVYWGAERLLPGDLTVTITEITDEQVCGTVTTITETQLQTFVGLKAPLTF